MGADSAGADSAAEVFTAGDLAVAGLAVVGASALVAFAAERWAALADADSVANAAVRWERFVVETRAGTAGVKAGDSALESSADFEVATRLHVLK